MKGFTLACLFFLLIESHRDLQRKDTHAFQLNE